MEEGRPEKNAWVQKKLLYEGEGTAEVKRAKWTNIRVLLF